MRRTLLALLLAVSASNAFGQALLYDPLPPKGSAYLRVVNAQAAPAKVEASFLPPATLGVQPAERVGPYTVVENVAGRALTIGFGAETNKGEAKLELAPGSFSTLLLLPGGRSVAVTDETQFNQVRAKLTFYNATADCADAKLTIEPDGPAVFEGLAAGAAKMRAVNPAEASVKASCSGGAAKPFPLAGLEAGGRYSIWLIRTPAPLAFITRDTTRTWKP